jgi:hypothetical protein
VARVAGVDVVNVGVLELPEVDASPEDRASESHVPRDELERPLVGFCGTVCPDPTRAPRDGRQGETASCVVCQDMWDSGVRPRNWKHG